MDEWINGSHLPISTSLCSFLSCEHRVWPCDLLCPRGHQQICCKQRLDKQSQVLGFALPRCETARSSFTEDKRPYGEWPNYHSFPSWAQPHSDPPASYNLMNESRQTSRGTIQVAHGIMGINPHFKPLCFTVAYSTAIHSWYTCPKTSFKDKILEKCY